MSVCTYGTLSIKRILRSKLITSSYFVYNCVSLNCVAGYVMSEAKKVFNISEDTETRLWNKYMSHSCELLSNMEQTVQDAGLYQGQVGQSNYSRPCVHIVYLSLTSCKYLVLVNNLL